MFKKILSLVLLVVIVIFAYFFLKSCSSSGVGGNALSKTGDLIGDVAKGTAGAVTDAAKGTVGAVGDVASGTAELVGDAAKGTVGAVGDVAKGTADLVGDAAKGTANAVGDVAKGTANLVGDAAKGTVGAVGDVAAGTAGLVEGAANKVFSGLIKGAKVLNDASKDIVGDPKAKSEVFYSQAIKFSVGSANLSMEAHGLLNKFAKYLNDSGYSELLIEGHTDSTGSAAGNVSLSENRAKSVQAYLATKLKPELAKAIEIKGVGSDQPMATNETDEGRKLNRRVVFKLTR